MGRCVEAPTDVWNYLTRETTSILNWMTCSDSSCQQCTPAWIKNDVCIPSIDGESVSIKAQFSCGSSSLSAGATAGMAIGVLLLAAVVALDALVAFKRHQGRRLSKSSESNMVITSPAVYPDDAEL